MDYILNDCSEVKQIEIGGQKTVYKAIHPRYGKVAVKIGNITSSSSLTRIEREFEALNSISSKYYPKQWFFKISDNKKQFALIEEFIEGKTLGKVSHLFNDQNKILTLLLELIEGLEKIWEKEIVHRDLKPDNIIIRPNMSPCILDLGIARFLNLESLTKTIFLLVHVLQFMLHQNNCRIENRI